MPERAWYRQITVSRKSAQEWTAVCILSARWSDPSHYPCRAHDIPQVVVTTFPLLPITFPPWCPSHSPCGATTYPMWAPHSPCRAHHLAHVVACYQCCSRQRWAIIHVINRPPATSHFAETICILVSYTRRIQKCHFGNAPFCSTAVGKTQSWQKKFRKIGKISLSQAHNSAPPVLPVGVFTSLLDVTSGVTQCHV